MVMPPEPGNPKYPPKDREHLYPEEMRRPKVVELPVADVRDIERGLNQLIADIGAGKYGAAHNVVWIVDCGNGRVEFGMLGGAAEPGPVAHLLMSLAQHRLVSETAKS